MELAAPLRTLEDAVAWLHECGFCLFQPHTAPVVAPDLLTAVAGSSEQARMSLRFVDDPDKRLARDLVFRMLRDRAAYVAPFNESNQLLIAPTELPYFYALVGERNPKQPPDAGPRGEHLLVRHTFELLEKGGPATVQQLHFQLGKGVSETAVDRALHDLWTKFRVCQIERNAAQQPVWDLLFHWAPEPVNQGRQLSSAEALSALMSRYLETVVAAETGDVENFFGHFIPRSRVQEIVRAMLGQRQFSYLRLGQKILVRMTPPPEPDSREASRQRYLEKPKLEPRVWKEKRPKGEWRPKSRFNRGPRPEFTRGPKTEFKPGASQEVRPPQSESKPEFKRGPRPEFKRGPRTEFKRGPRPEFSRGPGAKGRPARPPFGARRERPEGQASDRPPRFERGARPEFKRGPRPEFKRGPRPEFKRGPRDVRPGKFARNDRDRGPSRDGENRGARGKSFGGPSKFGEKKFGAKKFGGKKFGGKPFGAKASGGKSFGGKKFGGKPFGAKSSSGRKFGGKKFSGKPSFQNKSGPKNG